MSDLVDDIYTFVFGSTVHRETIKYRPTYPGDGELAFDYYLKTPLGIWRSRYDKNYTEYIINSHLKIVVYFTEIAKNNTTIDTNLPRFLVDKSDVYMGIFTPISTGEWIAFANFSQNNTRKISFRKKMVHNGEYIKEIIIMSDGTLVVNTYDDVSTTTTPNGEKTTKKPDGTELILQPSGLLTIITSGEIITVLSVTGSVATIAQLILMIIDMKSRKSNENKLSKLHPKASEKLDEIKEIAVLMSDSTRPSFKSWQHDPHEVKKFVEMFQSTPTAQKPLRVIFTLKNGSKIVIKVDENTADQQKLLDEFIEHLKN